MVKLIYKPEFTGKDWVVKFKEGLQLEEYPFPNESMAHDFYDENRAGYTQAELVEAA